MIPKDEEIREALKQAKIFKGLNHPDRAEICGRIIDPLIALSEAYLQAEGWPEKKDEDVNREGYHDHDQYYFDMCYARGFNKAIDACRLSMLKAVPAVEEIEDTLNKTLYENNVSAVAYKTDYRETWIKMFAQAIHKLLNKGVK